MKVNDFVKSFTSNQVYIVNDEYLNEEKSICLGTPDKCLCNCEGYKSRCDLHKGEDK